MQAGVDYLARRGIPAVAPFNFVLHELLHYRVGDFSEALTLIADEKTRRHVAEHLDQDFHGGFFETSLVLHYRPDTVAPSHRTLPPCPPVAPHRVFLWLSRAAARLGRLILAAEFKFAAYGIGWLRLRPLPGYTGWPALADARAGAAFAEVIMSRYVDGVEAVFAGSKPPPQPIMKWLRAVSLDGRLQAH
ncbi:MAG: creatininase family protein [Deltaproteobacteria bacterium]|nr:creatininase family protein [Deltaproteobacteria bacterium]